MNINSLFYFSIFIIIFNISNIASGEVTDDIQLISPGVELNELKDTLKCDINHIYDPECSQAATGNFSVFRWTSTLPINATYRLQIATDIEFINIHADDLIDTSMPFTNWQIISSIQGSLHFNFIPRLYGTGAQSAAFWKVIANVGGIEFESKTFVTFYHFSFFSDHISIQGQVVASDLSSLKITGANILIQSDVVDQKLGNLPNGIVDTRSYGDGRFLAVVNPFVNDQYAPEFAFPMKVTVEKDGFFPEEIIIENKPSYDDLLDSNGIFTINLTPFKSSVIQIVNAPPTVIKIYEQYSYVPVVVEPNDYTYTFSINGIPGWASFNTATGQLTGQPAAADVGKHGPITISVRNSVGAISSKVFTVEIIEGTSGSMPGVILLLLE